MRSTGLAVRLGSKQEQTPKHSQKPITLAHLRELVRDAEQMSDDTIVQVHDVQQLEEMTWSRVLRIRVVEWAAETANVEISK